MISNLVSLIEFDKSNDKYVMDFKNIAFDYLTENSCDFDANRYIESIIEVVSNDKKRFLMLLYIENECIGFSLSKIYDVDIEKYLYTDSADLGSGFPEWGYVLEFYVIPNQRLNGYGKLLYQDVLNRFEKYNIDTIWLTSSEKGKPFWKSFGFKSINKIAWNGQEIYKLII